MATIYSNTPRNAYRLKLDISQQSQSIPNNNSVIAYTLTMECLQPNTYGYSYPAGDKFTVTINGTTVFNSQVAIALGPAIHSKQICTGTTTVGHNADGSKSISFSCHKDACPLGGWTPPAMDASGSMILSTIPRASTPTLNKSSINIGDSIVITTNRVTTAFVHQINFSTDGGSTWTNITNGVTDSYTWTPSLDLLGPRFPNATSGKVRIGVDTYPSNNTHNYDKTTRIGWKWVEFTVNFPETSSIKPACGMSSVQEAGSGIPSGWGYVQGYSKLKLSGSSAVKGGANLLSTIVTADGKNYSVGNGSTWSVVTDTIKNSGSMYLSATCKDSRGYTDTGGQTVTVNAYSPPNPTLSLYRCDSAGNANDAGTYAKVTYAWSISSVGSKNAVKSGLVRYRKKGDSAWTSIVNSTTSNVASTTTTLSGFSVDNAYEFNISVQDGIRTVSKTVTLPAQTVPLYIAPDGKSVTFGSTQVTQGCLRSELPIIPPTRALSWTGALSGSMNAPIKQDLTGLSDGSFLPIMGQIGPTGAKWLMGWNSGRFKIVGWANGHDTSVNNLDGQFHFNPSSGSVQATGEVSGASIYTNSTSTALVFQAVSGSNEFNISGAANSSDLWINYKPAGVQTGTLGNYRFGNCTSGGYGDISVSHVNTTTLTSYAVSGTITSKAWSNTGIGGFSWTCPKSGYYLLIMNVASANGSQTLKYFQLQMNSSTNGTLCKNYINQADYMEFDQQVVAFQYVASGEVIRPGLWTADAGKTFNSYLKAYMIFGKV